MKCETCGDSTIQAMERLLVQAQAKIALGNKSLNNLDTEQQEYTREVGKYKQIEQGLLQTLEAMDGDLAQPVINANP